MALCGSSSAKAILTRGIFSRLPIRNLRKTSSEPPPVDRARRTSCLCSAPMKDCVSARHNYATQISIAGQVPSYETIFNWARVQSATMSDTYTVTPSMVNELRIGYNRFSPEYQVQSGFSLHDLGGNFPVLNGIPIPPQITITGRVTLGNNSSINAQLENEDYQLKDVLNWTRGHHSVKGGFD